MTTENTQAGYPGKRAWIGLLFCVLMGALVVYHRILSTPIVLDDLYLLAHLSDGLAHLFSDLGAHYFRPLIGVTLWIDRAIWGLNPLGYHLTNVITHGLTSFLVAVAGYLLMQDRGLSRRTAWIVACSGGAIFLVLPSHTEAVAWVSGRTDVVAAFLCMASFCAYLIGRNNGSRLYLWSAVVLFALATLAKESVLSYPFMLGGLEMFDRKDADGKLKWTSLRRVVPFFVVLVLYLPIRYFALGEIGGEATRGYHPSLTLHHLVFVFFHHVEGSFAPVNSTLLFLCWSVLLIVGVVVTIARRGPAASAVYLLSALFLLSLLPISTLDNARQGEQERYVYLPSVFAVLLIALVINVVCSHKRQWVAWIAAGGLILAFGCSLDRICTLWNVAGHMTEKVIASAHRLPAQRLIVLIAPRSLKSAWMLGNGFDSVPALYGWDSPHDIGVWVRVYLEDPSDKVEMVQEGDIWRMRLVSRGHSRHVSDSFRTPHPGRLLTRAELEAHCTSYALAHGHALGTDWAGVYPPNLEPGDRLVTYTCAALIDVKPLQVPVAVGR